MFNTLFKRRILDYVDPKIKDILDYENVVDVNREVLVKDIRRRYREFQEELFVA